MSDNPKRVWQIVDGYYSSEFTDVMTVPGGMVVRTGQALTAEDARVSVTFVPGQSRDIARWISDRANEWLARRKSSA